MGTQELLHAAELLESALVAAEDNPEAVDFGPAFEALRTLDAGQQKAAIARMAEANLEVLELLKRAIHASRQLLSHHAKASVDVTLKDVEVNPSLPLARQFCEMVLWTETMRVNAKSFAAVDALDAHEEGASEAAVSTPGGMRGAYMQAVTDAFGDDLDSLRKESTFDASKVAALVDSLELGLDIWPDNTHTLHLPSTKHDSAPAPVHARVRLRH